MVVDGGVVDEVHISYYITTHSLLYYSLQRHRQRGRGAHLLPYLLLTPYYTAHYSAIGKGEEVRISYAALERGPGAFVQNWCFVDQVRLPSYHPDRTGASSTRRRYPVILAYGLT